MNRRDILKISLLGVPAHGASDINANSSAINLYMLTRMLNLTVRFEMSTAQWTAWEILMTMAFLPKEQTDDTDNKFMFPLLPIVVNPKVPKDEVWLVAHDGTIMSKITHLVVPNGF
jgi:hypothetical protein